VCLHVCVCLCVCVYACVRACACMCAMYVQCGAACSSVVNMHTRMVTEDDNCGGVLQCVAVWYSMLQFAKHSYLNGIRRLRVCRSVLQCDAACCSSLQIHTYMAIEGDERGEVSCSGRRRRRSRSMLQCGV